MKLKKARLGSLYKKPKDKRKILKILTVVAVAVAAVVLTAAYGNLLKKRAAELPTDTTPPLSDLTPDEPPAPAVARGDLISLPLSPSAFANTEALRAALDALPECDAVTLSLRTAEEILWKSEAAAAIYGMETKGTLTAAELISEVTSRGKTASVVFATRAFSAQESSSLSPAEAAAVQSYERLLIAELWEAGAGEILLDGIPLSDAVFPALTDYCAELRTCCPGLTLGLCVPGGTGNTDAGLVLLARAERLFDWLCLDLTEAMKADLDARTGETAESGLPSDTAANADGYPTLKNACLSELLPISRFGMTVLLRVPEAFPIETAANSLLPLLAGFSLHSVSLLYQ